MTTLRNRRMRFRLPPAVIAGVLGLLVLIGAALVWRTGAEALWWKVFSPVFALRNSFGATHLERLQAELVATKAKLEDVAVLRAENTELKRLLGRETSSSRVLAAVIARPPFSPYDTLMLDVGTQKGITEGDLVSAGGSTIIGRVSQVEEHASRVVLFSAPGETQQALLTLSAKGGAVVPLSLSGQGSGSFKAEVPSGTLASVGDLVVLAGIEPLFSARVEGLSEGGGESFLTLYLRMPVNAQELRFVEVLTTPSL